MSNKCIERTFLCRPKQQLNRINLKMRLTSDCVRPLPLRHFVLWKKFLIFVSEFFINTRSCRACRKLVNVADCCYCCLRLVSTHSPSCVTSLVWLLSAKAACRFTKLLDFCLFLDEMNEGNTSEWHKSEGTYKNKSRKCYIEYIECMKWRRLRNEQRRL